ncbi:hypothetical protein OESDEN_14114 [Oesophagostomum dentatum]|uniref:Uncharacterized protein n=1 Tax=Oesophagostomum dentatum TaxID=61180 RepID=A0A0B1SML6_OESDE|nr:hypothetical protein OESDEN_14114 [Oesophagostomum dentatum]
MKSFLVVISLIGLGFAAEVCIGNEFVLEEANQVIAELPEAFRKHREVMKSGETCQGNVAQYCNYTLRLQRCTVHLEVYILRSLARTMEKNPYTCGLSRPGKLRQIRETAE